MDLRASSPSHAQPRPRVWQDTAAESLLALAVALIASTGVNPFVAQLNLWLAALVPAYDPMATMLAVMIVSIAGLILGSIRLKAAARVATEAPRVLRPARSLRARLLGTSPYAGS